MSNPSSPAKPAPLSFGRSGSNGRMSPFRRPESPSGQSNGTLRASTPSMGSPLKQSTSSLPLSSPNSTAPLFTLNGSAGADDRSWLNRGSVDASKSSIDAPPSRVKTPDFLSSSTSSLHAGAVQMDNSPTSTTGTTTTAVTARPPMLRTPTSYTARPNLNRSKSSDPLSSIPPHHLHTMRESFAVLDRNNTGMVTPTDLAHQLRELGLDSSATSASQYFPPGTSSLNLSAYLNALCSELTGLTDMRELTEAFSAFDVDDSGQIDVQELKDAVLTTMPEDGRRLTENEVDAAMEGFVGRRAFRRGAAGMGGGLEKKPVFRYGDFVKGIWGAEPAEGRDAVAA